MKNKSTNDFEVSVFFNGHVETESVVWTQLRAVVLKEKRRTDWIGVTMGFCVSGYNWQDATKFATKILYIVHKSECESVISSLKIIIQRDPSNENKLIERVMSQRSYN